MKKEKRNRVILDEGFPAYLNFKPSTKTLAMMREDPVTGGRRREAFNQNETARAYAEWLARRDGLTVPKSEGERPLGARTWRNKCNKGVRWHVEYQLLPGAEWHKKNQRAARVIWREGFWEEQYTTAKRPHATGVYHWREEDKPVLTVEIPNWDHQPDAIDVSSLF